MTLQRNSKCNTFDGHHGYQVTSLLAEYVSLDQTDGHVKELISPFQERGSFGYTNLSNAPKKLIMFGFSSTRCGTIDGGDPALLGCSKYWNELNTPSSCSAEFLASASSVLQPYAEVEPSSHPSTGHRAYLYGWWP